MLPVFRAPAGQGEDQRPGQHRAHWETKGTKAANLIFKF